MLLVKNHYVFKELSLFDPRTRRLFPTEEEYDYATNISGRYSNVDDELIALYREDGRLRLLLNDRVYDFDQLRFTVLSKRKTVVGYEIRWTREVLVDLCNQCVYRRQYNNFCEEFVDDDMLMIEPEDFDFYLFLRNVSRDSGRKERILAAFVE